jgi:serine/threonine protein kinase
MASRGQSVDIPNISGLQDITKIGEGGFGVVYRARQTHLDRDVAVKVLTAAADDADAHRRFRREAMALGRLSGHPNIVAIYDVGQTEDGRTYIAMPLLVGGSLQDRMDRSGPQDWGSVVDLGIRIAGALATAHSAGVLHRDVKPDNVLFDRVGHPLLADFGIARMADATTATATGRITATVAYAPPEVLDGRDPSPATDIYSLAATLVAAIRGRPAFTDGDPAFTALLARIGSEAPPDLTTLGVPPPVDQVLRAGMAKEPADRPNDAMAFAKRLQEAQRLSGVPSTAVPHESTVPSASQTVAHQFDVAAASGQSGTEQPQSRRRSTLRTGLIVVAAAAVASVGGMATAVMLSSEPRDEPTERAAAAVERETSSPTEAATALETAEQSAPQSGPPAQQPSASPQPTDGSTVTAAPAVRGVAQLLPFSHRETGRTGTRGLTDDTDLFVISTGRGSFGPETGFTWLRQVGEGYEVVDSFIDDGEATLQDVVVDQGERLIASVQYPGDPITGAYYVFSFGGDDLEHWGDPAAIEGPEVFTYGVPATIEWEDGRQGIRVELQFPEEAQAGDGAFTGWLQAFDGESYSDRIACSDFESGYYALPC